MLLRYLEEITLKKATKEKQANGTYTNTYASVGTYKVQVKDLSMDQVSATIYGATVSKMIRVSSPLKDLENYLLTKVNNSNDNLSYYFINYANNLYKITSVSSSKIDLERL